MKITKIIRAVWDSEATASAYYDTGQIRCFIHQGSWKEASCPDVFTKARLVDDPDQFERMFPGIGLPKWPEPTTPPV